MNNNIIIIIAGIGTAFLILAGFILINGMQSSHHSIAEIVESNPMAHMPCHQMPDGSWMGDCENLEDFQMDHSHMNHEVSSELEFIVEMIPHHQEAVDSSRQLLELGTNNQELENLLHQIIIAQEEEISMMQNWLQEWYPNESHEAMYMEMMPDLSRVSEDQRDRAYIVGMIMHHQMAIVMAESVLEIDGIRDEVRELALEIIRVQEEEINLMNSFLS